MKKRILFISHEASLTGAPLVLLYFMEWLIEQHPDDYELGILHLKGGGLEQRFNKLVEHVFKVAPIAPTFIHKVAKRILPYKLVPKSPKPTDTIVDQINQVGFDMIYANTALTLDIATAIKHSSPIKTILVAHIHEMHVSLKSFVKNPDRIVPQLDKIIAVAQVVKMNILQEWGVEDEKVEIVYEFSKTNIDVDKVRPKEAVFTVGASGRAGWRKGNDLFVQVASCIKAKYPDASINFEWIGRIDAHELLIVEEDLKKLDLNNVEFLGLKPHPHPCFQNFDVFLMTSKEDPFPLVCIEVGMMGKPIICFDQATGTQEVIKNGGGQIVPYLNVDKMAEAVVKYYDDRDLLKHDGEEAKKLFSQFTPEIRCPQIYSIIQKLISA